MFDDWGFTVKHPAVSLDDSFHGGIEDGLLLLVADQLRKGNPRPILTTKNFRKLAQANGPDIPYRLNSGRSDWPPAILAAMGVGDAQDLILAPAGKQGQYQLRIVNGRRWYEPQGSVAPEQRKYTNCRIFLSSTCSETRVATVVRRENLLAHMLGLPLEHEMQEECHSVRGTQIKPDDSYWCRERDGRETILFVEIKSTERISLIQIDNNFEIGAAKFPGLACRCISIQHHQPTGTLAITEFRRAHGWIEPIPSSERYFQFCS